MTIDGAPANQITIGWPTANEGRLSFQGAAVAKIDRCFLASGSARTSGASQCSDPLSGALALARQPLDWKQRNLTRAIKGARAAGVEVARVTIDVKTGNIVIEIGKPVESERANKEIVL